MIGVIVAMAALASVVVKPAVGWALDHFGRMPIIYVGNVVNVVAALLYLTVSSIGPWLIFVRILHGLALATLFSAFFTYGADVVPESRRVEGFALFGVSGLLPVALAGLIGDFVIRVAGFRELFLTAAAMALVALFLSIPLPERRPEIQEGAGRAGFLAMVRHRNLRPIWFMTGSMAVVLTAYFTFLRTFVDETGIGSVGLFFATYGAAAIALRIGLGWLPERVGPKRVLFPAMASLSVGLVLLALAEANWQVGVAGVLCGIGHGFGFPILSGFVVSRAPDEDRGSAVSFFTALFDFGALIGAPIFGGVISWFDYRTMFIVAATFLVVALATFGRWDRSAVPTPAPTRA